MECLNTSRNYSDAFEDEDSEHIELKQFEILENLLRFEIEKLLSSSFNPTIRGGGF